MSVSDKVLDAIQLLATNSVEKAGYDKTIQAQVLSCEDATIGKYRCRYQDAIIYAYTNNPNVIFNKGAYVYILVPGSDMNKEKTILGTTQKLGINYISQAEGDEAYNLIGNNNIVSNDKFYLDTNNKNYKYILYQYGRTPNDIEIDETALEQYLKESSSLIAGAAFKTSIASTRQYRGHYGITYNLRFLDNTSNTEVIRSYTIDEDNMVDNPYRLVYPTRQYQIFNIDGPNFIRVESIEIFNKDFPEAAGTVTDEKLLTGDIEITALELNGAERMTENEIGGVAISFYTPQGTFFTNSSTADSYKTIVAQVKVKGKLVSAAQNIPFYWGAENAGISPSSENYNKYLGRGWECLNDKNTITDATEDSEAVVEWVPSGDTYIFGFKQATAKDNKIKVAIVYDGNIITKEINIQNLSTNVPSLTIESSDGTKFYYDIGHPTLTCKVNGQEELDYKYYWAYENNAGLLEELSETTDLNAQYEDAVAALQGLQTAIAAGTKFENAESENLIQLQEAVKAYNFIQRVQKNKIYDVQINNITSFGIFKCSVYNDENVYLGTAAITLTNSLNGEDLYSLVINNGSVVFQYDENGVAPNNGSLITPQQLRALSFTIYDNLGQPIDSDIIANTKNCQIRWEYPIKDTMLVQQQENEPDAGTDAEEAYRYYDNKLSLIYNITPRYDLKKQRNQIKLTVNYKGMSLTAETEFTFTKQGEPGTNGTDYVVKLVPNTLMKNPPLWPMITKAGSDYILNYGINSPAEEQTISTSSSYQLFKAQLWHSGDLVWEGASTATAAYDGVTKPSAITWEVLKNKYNSSTSDASAFVVTNANEGRIQYTGDHLQSALSTPLANIIKCSVTWQNKTYYGTIPITTAWVSDSNHRVALKDNTGFRHVTYTSDGMQPQYDNAHPFEFICLEKINDIWEDVSLVSGNHAVTYTPSAVGNYLSTNNGAATNGNLLQILTNEAYRRGCKKNQWKARPASRYDGACINVAVCCIYTQNNNIVGRISVPIHYLLNRYGLANINAWDGNSVQIDDTGGYILSPQIGAGRKENDNSFTGMIMGEAREAGKTNPSVGLLGYASGTRTVFLNSQNGSAIFGKQGNGQLIVDPVSNKALLYSNNFWKNYQQNGLPTNYTSSNENGAGLLIDLTTPAIRFGNGNFSVGSDGKLTAKSATISGSVTAQSGKIGGWTIGTSTLTAGNITLNSNGSMSGGSGNNTWSIATDGKATFNHLTASKGGTIGGWTIGASTLTGGNITLNSNGSMGGGSGNNTWSIATDGKATFNHLTANKGGSIGGWTIGTNSLKGGTLTLNNSGAISGSNWSVSADGLAYFKKIYGEIADGHTISGGGTTIGNGGTNIPTYTTVGGTGLSTYVKNLVVNTLNVTDSFTFNGVSVKWQTVNVVTTAALYWSTVTGKLPTNLSIDDRGFVVAFNQTSTAIDIPYNLQWARRSRKLYLLTNASSEQ